MIFLSEDAYRSMKRFYIKHCIKMILVGAGMYAIIKKLSDQEEQIDNLTKQIKELSLKGE